MIFPFKNDTQVRFIGSVLSKVKKVIAKELEGLIGILFFVLYLWYAPDVTFTQGMVNLLLAIFEFFGIK
jgi:hypothetical protein